MATRTELGCPGHFILGDRCNWRRHTQVDGTTRRFRISSVGDLLNKDGTGPRQPIGGRGPNEGPQFYETARCLTEASLEVGTEECGCHVRAGHVEILRRYSNRGEAQRGHELAVREAMRLADDADEFTALAEPA